MFYCYNRSGLKWDNLAKALTRAIAQLSSSMQVLFFFCQQLRVGKWFLAQTRRMIGGSNYTGSKRVGTRSSLIISAIGSNVESSRESRRDWRLWGRGSSPSFLTLFQSGVVHVRGHGVVCIVGSRKFTIYIGCTIYIVCPGFCTDVKVTINEIYVRGGTGVGPPLVYLTVRGNVTVGTQIDEWWTGK